eukprot:TRINITY_DN0_c257_g1_i1.p1 TRINITY_DN0_c257_g1~~TRINITY_DN0_c257_g1_i1.p1  ORF type:complete len:157 (+),score=44.32 TRINITY_DN0_c257_g1_i1:60-530(+)
MFFARVAKSSTSKFCSKNKLLSLSSRRYSNRKYTEDQSFLLQKGIPETFESEKTLAERVPLRMMQGREEQNNVSFGRMERLLSERLEEERNIRDERFAEDQGIEAESAKALNEDEEFKNEEKDDDNDNDNDDDFNGGVLMPVIGILSRLIARPHCA